MDLHSLQIRRIKIRLILFLPLLITSILWWLAKVDRGSVLSIEEFPRLMSQLVALWSVVLLSYSYILSSKSHTLEKLLRGLDKVYQYHAFIGKTVFVLILLHPVLLIIYYWGNWPEVISLLLPFVGNTSLAKSAALIGLFSYILLISVTLLKLFSYHIWKLTHSFIGIPFFLIAYHSLFAYSDVKYYLPLQLWILFWITLGIISYIYITLLYKHFGPKYLYSVSDIHKVGTQNYELRLKPNQLRLQYEPGEFVYISFTENERISSELHPFSIFSDPSKDELVISYKELGDYTVQLKNAQIGDRVEVFGPYGEFTSYIFNSYKKQVWIAGGIGVTPFMSMLHYEATNGDKKDITFFYSNNFDKEKLYLDEIQQVVADADDHIRFIGHNTDTEGFLTGELIITECGKDTDDTLFLLCGPPMMMQALSKQLKDCGVGVDRIIFENFGFK